MEVCRPVDRRQKALVYKFLKPHREDFIPQLEPDVKLEFCFLNFGNFGLSYIFFQGFHLLYFDFALLLENLFSVYLKF